MEVIELLNLGKGSVDFSCIVGFWEGTFFFSTGVFLGFAAVKFQELRFCRKFRTAFISGGMIDTRIIKFWDGVGT